MARSPQISNHRKPVLLTSLAYRIIHLATCFWIVSCKVNTETVNWRDTQQKRCRSWHRSKIDSATGFLFPKATWRVQEAALVTLWNRQLQLKLPWCWALISKFWAGVKIEQATYPAQQEADCHWKMVQRRGTPLADTHTPFLWEVVSLCNPHWPQS